MEKKRLLCGVVGEGMGHATRSAVTLAHARAQGHELMIVASGRAFDYLSARFENVQRIHGLHMIYEENEVRPVKTLLSNLRAGFGGLPHNVKVYWQHMMDFKPDGVISDFESDTYLFGKMHGVPILSIDNMQVINRCRHDRDIVAGHRASYHVAKTLVRAKLPYCDQYFITSFFKPKVRLKHTRLFPPILREAVLGAFKRPGEHLVVYTTGEGNQAFVDELRKLPQECRVYGMRRDLKEELVEGNLRYRPFSEHGFIDDLASARAVIAGGGFSLMGEAVYLQKPMLAVPMGGQFEQVLNARYLEKLGYGMMTENVNDPGAAQRFLANVPRYEARLSGYRQDGNVRIFKAIDAWCSTLR